MLTRATPMRASSGMRNEFGLDAGHRVHQVDRYQAVNLAHGALDIGAGADAVDERHVGARFQVQVGAADGLVQAIDGVSVGAGVDDEVRRRRASRASAMARTLPAISSAAITCLPSMWPQRLGKTWSSMLTPATPIVDQALGDIGGVERIAAAGIDIRHHRDAHGPDDLPGVVQDVLHLHQPDVGLRRAGCRRARSR